MANNNSSPLLPRLLNDLPPMLLLLHPVSLLPLLPLSPR
jgi:hypothetical protein